jgi:hypothetical protein
MAALPSALNARCRESVGLSHGILVLCERVRMCYDFAVWELAGKTETFADLVPPVSLGVGVAGCYREGSGE